MTLASARMISPVTAKSGVGFFFGWGALWGLLSLISGMPERFLYDPCSSLMAVVMLGMFVGFFCICFGLPWMLGRDRAVCKEVLVGVVTPVVCVMPFLVPSIVWLLITSGAVAILVSIVASRIAPEVLSGDYPVSTGRTSPFLEQGNSTDTSGDLRKKVRRVYVVGLTASLVLCGVMLTWAIVHRATIKFEPTAYRNASEIEQTWMLGDAASRLLFVGKTEEEIRAIFGGNWALYRTDFFPVGAPVELEIHYDMETASGAADRNSAGVYGRIEFQPEAWREADDKARREMLHSLMTTINDAKSDIPRKKVLEWLGDPARSSAFFRNRRERQAGAGTRNRLIESTLELDMVTTGIRINFANGKVTSANYVYDPD